nr:restriction endonuclease subunit S [Mannheimia haemolytica]
MYLASEFLSLKGKGKARIAIKDSILINGIGNIGQMGILRVDGAFNQQMHSLTFYGKLNVNAIYYFLQSEFLQLSMKNLSSQTTIPIMNKSSFESILVPIPPIAEQHSIVEKIEQLFSEIDKL